MASIRNSWAGYPGGLYSADESRGTVQGSVGPPPRSVGSIDLSPPGGEHHPLPEEVGG